MTAAAAVSLSVITNLLQQCVAGRQALVQGVNGYESSYAEGMLKALDLLQIAALDSKPSKKAALEQTVAQAITSCLTKPFSDAASVNNRHVLTALAQAWVVYLASMQAKRNADEPFLIDAAAKLVELLASAGGHKAGTAATDSGCGPGNDLGPGQGEMPHAQAAVLYVIRVAVMEQLSESGQVSWHVQQKSEERELS